MIDEAWNNMGKSVEFSDKAVEHERVAKYWDKKAEVINLSMPESIDYYEHKLEKAKEYHEGLKSGKYPREHSYSLTYAKKAVNDMQRIMTQQKIVGRTRGLKQPLKDNRISFQLHSQF